MTSIETITEFVRTNFVITIFTGIFISLLIWKIREHFTNHRNLSTLARDIHLSVRKGSWSDPEERHGYQGEVASAAEELMNYHRHNPVKNERVLSRMRETAEACQELSEIWEIKDVTGPLETSNTHGSMNVHAQLRSQGAAVEETCSRLQREIRLSFIVSPFINTLKSAAGILSLFRRGWI